MARKKRTPVPVEVCPYADDERHALERLGSAARRLIRHSPERVGRLVAIAEAWLVAYEQSPESPDMVAARKRRITGSTVAN